MKTGKSLVELAQEIERQQNTKRDFVADTRKINFAPLGKADADARGHNVVAHLMDTDLGGVGLNSVAHRQVSEHTGIPAKYYDRMLADHPTLLATNVNTWMHDEPAPRMVRTLDGVMRAFLSDRYRPLENYDLAQAVIPVLLAAKIEVLSCEVTERRLYIKGVDARINRDVPSGKNRMGDGSHVIFDTCSPAIVISNSEVGMGALSVETAIWTKACTNLAIFGQKSLRKYHVGGRHELGEGLQELLSSETRAATDKATWMQVTDVVKGAFDEAKFAAMCQDVARMGQDKITADPVKVVELTAKRMGFGEAEKGSILRHLIEGADLSRYGLFNAITRTAEDLASYDRATEFERAGGQIIELAANDWKELAEAA